MPERNVIVFKVKNNKVINRLSRKSIVANKTRNIIAIIAIALTTILFTSLFTAGIGMMESIRMQTLRQSGGDGHIVLKYLSEDQYQKLKTHKLVKEASYSKIIAYAVTNPELLKRRMEMYYMDEIAMRLGFCTLTTGKAPVLVNEIAMDTQSLDLLGVPHTVGSKVTLSYIQDGKELTTDFVLSGFWESDTTLPVGFGLVSEAYTKEHADELEYTFDKDSKYEGAINSYVMCNNSFNLWNKMERIVTESGYTLTDDDNSTPARPTDIACNTNWSYVGSGEQIDASAIVAVLAGIILITFTGYLIIFNVFQISVLNDIRFYGLLKTIGTTGKQLKRIVTRQALFLSIIGIPIGLVSGFFIGKAVLPLVMSQTSYGAESVVSINPLIFIGSTVFSLITIFLSTRKPCRIAAQVSPIEAVRYNGGSTMGKKSKRSRDGGKVYRMAMSNLSRSKKSTIITVLSLSLSIVLLNTVYTVSIGFDLDKYIDRFVDADFLAGHANYFNMNHVTSADDATSESLISAIESQESFKAGGRFYYDVNVAQSSIERPLKQGQENAALDGKPMLMLLGMDAFPLSRIELHEGALDLDKLATGKYIIEGLYTDDYGNADKYAKASPYEIGDKVTLNVDGKSREFEILAKMKVAGYTDSPRYSLGDNVMYLPSDVFKELVDDPVIMSYAYNVKPGGEQQMEDFIKHYTENVESSMGYESKLKYINEFQSMQSMVKTIGGVVSAIMGLIGLLNFVNSILTSFNTRKRELATLQSIGMTKKQLVQMLCLEGVYYSAMTVVASVILGILFSATVVGGIIGTLWMFSYHFTLVPIFIICPIMLFMGIVIPFIVYHSAGKQSIVERLREV